MWWESIITWSIWSADKPSDDVWVCRLILLCVLLTAFLLALTKFIVLHLLTYVFLCTLYFLTFGAKPCFLPTSTLKSVTTFLCPVSELLNIAFPNYHKIHFSVLYPSLHLRHAHCYCHIKKFILLSQWAQPITYWMKIHGKFFVIFYGL